MRTTVEKLNRVMMVSVFVLFLALGGLSGCGVAARNAVAASAPVSPRASHMSASCEESCRAFHRLPPPFDGQCDEETRALARIGVAVTCASATATIAAAGK